MNIFEATKKAAELGGEITRFSRLAETWTGVLIKPTDDIGCCMIRNYGTEECPAPRWQPQLDDLLAEDWVVVMAD